MADKGPQTLHTERKEEHIAQQPVDDEAAREGPGAIPYSKTGEDQRHHPDQDGHEPDLRTCIHVTLYPTLRYSTPQASYPESIARGSPRSPRRPQLPK